MRKFKVCYWQETGDECYDYEVVIEAQTFEKAFEEFRKMYHYQKITEIKQIV